MFVGRFANSHSIGATGELIATTMRTSLLRLATTVHTRLSSDVLSRESRWEQGDLVVKVNLGVRLEIKLLLQRSC